MPHANLRIIPVTAPRDLKQFLRFPSHLYRRDPHWIAPLYHERKEILNPKKNPFFHHATVQLFLALRGSKPVGRISAQIDFMYEKFHGERVGHFGFFECENDPKIAAELFRNAEIFLRKNGATRVLGPFSFSINDESGILTEGFGEPLMIMMPYNPPYYPALLESAGYQKAKDLFAWKYLLQGISEEPAQIAAVARLRPGLKVRSIDMRNFKRDLEIIMDIFNSAWSENWGFVPLTPEEVNKAARDLKLIIQPDLGLIAEIHDIPAAMLVAIPNIYDLLQGLNGRLFPLGIFKLLWRLKRKKFQSGRLMLFGTKKEFRKGDMGKMNILLFLEILKVGLRKGIDFAELSWTLEDNQAINASIEFMGGKRYKSYRIYEKNLNGGDA